MPRMIEDTQPDDYEPEDLGEEYVTKAVIARRYGVSASAVNRWSSYPDFPEPLNGLTGTQVFPWRIVVAWKNKRQQ